MQANVHDAFFKEMLSRPEHAASILRQILPASIAARIDFAVAPHVPRFAFVLEDLSHQTDEALRARAMRAPARLSLWCLRHAGEPWDLVDRLAAATMAQLDTWSMSLLTAPPLDEVFADA